MPEANPKGRSRKRLSRAQSKKVSFSKKASRKMSKKSFDRRPKKKIVRQSNNDAKNNQELTTLDMFINNKSKYKISALLLKDQPLQTLKYTNQGYFTATKSSQGYNFINIFRADMIEKLFSYVSTDYQYVKMNNNTGNPQIIDNNVYNDVVLKDFKVFIQNINLKLKIKNGCNAAQNIAMYVLKPRYDINYVTNKKYVVGTNTQVDNVYYNIEDIFNNGVIDNNSIKCVTSAQSVVNGNTLGITPYESSYLTKNFKILSKYSRTISLSDGGNADISLDIPYNKVIGLDRLSNNFLNQNSSTYLNKWVKGFSFVIMLVYYGDQGINVNGTTKVCEVLPCENLQMIDYKIDFKVCNNQKAKIQQFGALSAPAGGTDQTFDEQGNLITYTALI